MSNTPSIIQTQQYQTPDLLRNIGTGDLKKTEEAYKKVGLRYEKPPQQLKEEKWYAQVTNHEGIFMKTCGDSKSWLPETRDRNHLN